MRKAVSSPLHPCVLTNDMQRFKGQVKLQQQETGKIKEYIKHEMRYFIKTLRRQLKYDAQQSNFDDLRGV